MKTFSHRGFKVNANSVKEGIDKLVEKIVEYEEARNFVFRNAEKLVHGWCICDYYIKFNDPSNKKEDEEYNLIDIMEKFRNLRFEHFNSAKMRKRVLKEILYDCYEYHKVRSTTNTFMYMHEDFSIGCEEKYYEACAKDFIKELPELIRIMSEEKFTKIYDYVHEKFNQKKKLKLKR